MENRIFYERIYYIVGIHTFSMYHKLKYEEAQNLIERLFELKCCCLIKENLSATNRIFLSNYYADYGILIYVYQRLKSSGISFRITPCTLLDQKDAAEKLYRPTEKNFHKIEQVLDKILLDLELNSEWDDGIFAWDLSLSRVDPCVNFYTQNEAMTKEYLRIFKKAARIPKYSLDSFTKETKRIKNIQKANEHSFRIKSKRASFTAYDKVYELQQSDRCPENLMRKGILRAEAELKREALLKRIHIERTCSNYETLKAASENAEKVIADYLKKMKIGSGNHIRFGDAVKLIEGSSLKPKRKDLMTDFLYKVTASRTLDTALDKLRREHRLSKNQAEKVLDKFDELGISPLTLRNDSAFEILPSLRSCLEENDELFNGN